MTAVPYVPVSPIKVLLLLALAACHGPDGFTVGAEHQWNDWQTIGFTPNNKFNALDGGESTSVNASLHWSIGPRPPAPREDWDEWRALVNQLQERRQPETINISTQTYGPQLPPSFNPDAPPERATTMTLLEWYAGASLYVQLLVATLLLALLVVLAVCRRQVVAVIRLIPPFRSNKKEKEE